MAWTDPASHVYAVGEVLSAGTLNTYVKDNLLFLYRRPAVTVSNSANISIPNASDTALTFNTEQFDVDNMHSTSSNTGRITINTAGLYYFWTQLEWASNSAGQRSVWVWYKGVTTIARNDASPVGSSGHSMGCGRTALFAAGDYIETFANQNSGGALNVIADTQSPYFSAFFLGSN
jgi:hypothetical protein